ncbi:hypothetical protein F2Q69_00051891 [Brassica cretica]|uniref:Uncharacterized protein n=1 Tax=Brassica cretica TaxID=69181 RepID=A0A8S9Q1Q2_BRACR|nr:hypothetical protein F2Q69_00051891 [Brassica cretica]
MVEEHFDVLTKSGEKTGLSKPRHAQPGQSKSLAGEGKLGGTEEEETVTSESGVVAGESAGGEAHSGEKMLQCDGFNLYIFSTD